jgi:hypothetical protein
MPAAKLFGTVALVVAVAGCGVSSLNPLASDVLYCPSLLGNWVFDSQDGARLSIVWGEDAVGYKVSLLRRTQDSADYSVKLIRLGTHWYVDAIAMKNMGIDAVPIHHILRIDIGKNTLALQATRNRPR